MKKDAIETVTCMNNSSDARIKKERGTVTRGKQVTANEFGESSLRLIQVIGLVCVVCVLCARYTSMHPGHLLESFLQEFLLVSCLVSME